MSPWFLIKNHQNPWKPQYLCIIQGIIETHWSLTVSFPSDFSFFSAIFLCVISKTPPSKRTGNDWHVFKMLKLFKLFPLCCWCSVWGKKPMIINFNSQFSGSKTRRSVCHIIFFSGCNLLQDWGFMLWGWWNEYLIFWWQEFDRNMMGNVFLWFLEF